MIDIHSHLLPNLDDGSSTVGQSVAVLNQFAKSGVTAVVLTPHVSSRELVDDPDDPVERRQVALEALQAAAPPMPELHLGFEIMLDQLDAGDVLSDPRFSMAGLTKVYPGTPSRGVGCERPHEAAPTGPRAGRLRASQTLGVFPPTHARIMRRHRSFSRAGLA